MNQDYKELQEKYLKLVKGKGTPVGIKLLKDKKKAPKKVIFPKEQRALCQYLKEAATYEKTRGVTKENLGGCLIGSRVLGFQEIPEEIEKKWIKGFGYTEERFRQLMDKMNKIKIGKYEAAILAPLKEFNELKIDPEVVITTINTAQAYLLLQGIFDKTGEKTSSTMNGHATCETIVSVQEKGKTWISIPCGGTRSLSGVQDDELWMGMTPEKLGKALERMEETNIKYPLAVNQMVITQPNPKHTLTSLITDEED
ncbi:MAG: DUF169 domain-containing protein [archaeon]